MKVSEKHQKSEKSKKNQTQTLSLNASKLFINQWEQIKQNKENDSEKIFIKKNENWYETVLHETKILQIEKINKLITCEWSHWITCHNDECKKHWHMKKKISITHKSLENTDYKTKKIDQRNHYTKHLWNNDNE